MQVIVSSGVFMKEGGLREPFSYHVSVQYICSRSRKDELSSSPLFIWTDSIVSCYIFFLYSREFPRIGGIVSYFLIPVYHKFIYFINTRGPYISALISKFIVGFIFCLNVIFEKSIPKQSKRRVKLCTCPNTLRVSTSLVSENSDVGVQLL